MTNLYCPEADTITEESTEARGPIKAAPSNGTTPRSADAAPRTWSQAFVHVFAWISVVGGVGLAALILLGQLGGAGLSLLEIGIVVAMGVALVGIGLRLRQYPWADDSAR